MSSRSRAPSPLRKTIKSPEAHCIARDEKHTLDLSPARIYCLAALRSIRCGYPRFPSGTLRRFRVALGILITTHLCGCSSLPPGADLPKQESVASAFPEQTKVGQHFATSSHHRHGESAFRILSIGADGFAARMQMLDTVERTLDLQYFIFRGDATGRLICNALLRAADRGVHARILLDDGQTNVGDEQISALAAHPNIEIRIFNPFAYRGHNEFLRGVEFLFNSARLDYRMHNKLLVADNASALIGGRNIGNPFFQIDPDSQFADDDVFVGGPVVQKLSTTFDEYWNSALAIPLEAVASKPTTSDLALYRTHLAALWEQAQRNDIDYVKRATSGDPVTGILSGQLLLVWSQAQVDYDSPQKKRVANGSMVGQLMYQPVAQEAFTVESELLMVTPYFVPTGGEIYLFKRLHERHVRVRILTNSLESTNELAAQAGYARHRLGLLEAGVELYEVRALLGNTQGSGQTKAISRHGNYGLHAKLFVFDRRKVFIGSMNFDQRSIHLNTEVGLIIDSPVLAAQTAARFAAMTQPANAYSVVLNPDSSGNPHLLWRTQEAGRTVDYADEPARDGWQRFAAKLWSLLPLDSEL